MAVTARQLNDFHNQLNQQESARSQWQKLPEERREVSIHVAVDDFLQDKRGPTTHLPNQQTVRMNLTRMLVAAFTHVENIQQSEKAQLEKQQEAYQVFVQAEQKMAEHESKMQAQNSQVIEQQAQQEKDALEQPKEEKKQEEDFTPKTEAPKKEEKPKPQPTPQDSMALVLKDPTPQPQPTTGPDYYKILGVSRNASKDDIRAAFKKLAREYHPDKNNSPEAADMFKNVYEAYENLNDPGKRAQYDQKNPDAGRAAPEKSIKQQPDLL